jgi:DNA-binding CsgD family transcriptional regulator
MKMAQSLRDLCASNLTLEQIAAEVGVSVYTIKKHMKLQGLTRTRQRGKGRGYACCSTEDVLKLWDMGLAASQIAERLHVSVTSVSARLPKGRPRRAAFEGTASQGLGCYWRKT